MSPVSGAECSARTCFMKYRFIAMAVWNGDVPIWYFWAHTYMILNVLIFYELEQFPAPVFPACDAGLSSFWSGPATMEDVYVCVCMCVRVCVCLYVGLCRNTMWKLGSNTGAHRSVP